MIWFCLADPTRETAWNPRTKRKVRTAARIATLVGSSRKGDRLTNGRGWNRAGSSILDKGRAGLSSKLQGLNKFNTFTSTRSAKDGHLLSLNCTDLFFVVCPLSVFFLFLLDPRLVCM